MDWPLGTVPSNVLVVSNAPHALLALTYNHAIIKEIFEQYGRVMLFEVLTEASKVRIGYEVREEAVLARLALHGREVFGSVISILYEQRPEVDFAPVPLASLQRDVSPSEMLQVPELEKQFLISPPPSPPIGWEQSTEDGPVINHELIAAIERLREVGCIWPSICVLFWFSISILFSFMITKAGGDLAAPIVVVPATTETPSICVACCDSPPPLPRRSSHQEMPITAMPPRSDASVPLRHRELVHPSVGVNPAALPGWVVSALKESKQNS
eukprot:m.210125 g.210125  ORF g.210125 m.210125 type:complete len:270 (-) comp53957_c0_seq7:1879-2688(-)